VFTLRVRNFVVALILATALPVFASPREGDVPRGPIQRIIKVIKHVLTRIVIVTDDPAPPHP